MHLWEKAITLTGVHAKLGLDTLKVLLKEGLASVKHGTVVQPLLWLCGTFSLGCFVIAILAKDGWIEHRLFIIGACPPLLALFSYVYFMFRDPDRLHSEEFQLKSRSLSTVESKGGTVPILPVELSTDPYPRTRKLLAESGEGEPDE